MKQYFVYIMASRKNGNLYTGVTDNLSKRVYSHKKAVVKGFTEKNLVPILVYYKKIDNVESAVMQDKLIKNWQRGWKIQLIESMNPEWKDLYEDLD